MRLHSSLRLATETRQGQRSEHRDQGECPQSQRGVGSLGISYIRIEKYVNAKNAYCRSVVMPHIHTGSPRREFAELHCGVADTVYEKGERRAGD